MSKLTYSEIFEFIINYMDKTQNELALTLSTSETTISRIKNRKQHYLASLDPNTLYDEVFQQHEPSKDVITRFWKFLLETDTEKENIIVSYYNEKCQEDISPDVFRTFFKKALYTAFGNGKSLQAQENKERKRKKAEATISGSPESSEPANIPQVPHSETPIRFSQYYCEPRDCFYGRTDLLETIHESLRNNRTAIICGIGGLGKSFAADRYAELCANEYGQIQKVVFSSNIQDTILKIPFEGLNETHYSTEDRIEKRFSILEAFGADTLLIIDNMDMCPEDRENYDRLKKMPMHVLFTSRETNFDSENYLIPIEPLSEKDQLDLFKDHYGYADLSDMEIKSLLNLFHLVEGHTLLIEMIAKTMRESDLTAEEMTECLTKGDYNAVSSISIEKDNQYAQGKIDSFVSNLFTTTKLNDEEKRTLMLLSFSSVNGIRRRVFKELMNADNMDSINMLINKSWIVKNAGSHPSQLKIHLHPVIQTAVFNNTNPTFDDCKAYLFNVLNAFHNQAYNAEDRMDLWVVLYRIGTLLNFDEQSLNMLIESAEILFDAFQFRMSMELFDKAVFIEKTIKPEALSAEIFCRLYTGRGDNAVRLADYEKAVADFKHLIQYLEGFAPDNPKERAAAYSKLASVFRKASQYQQALEYFETAKEILDEADVKNDNLSLYASIINDMGVVYINLNRYDEALKYYRNALEIRESFENPNEKNLAFSYHNIGTVYQRQKKFSEAIHYHKIGLRKRESVCDRNDPVIFASLIMIGNDYTEAAKADPEHYSFDDAIDYFDRGLQGRINTLGESHPDTAWAYASIGKWYLYQGQNGAAIEEFKKCLAIRETALGKEHAYTGQVHSLLSEAYTAAGDQISAEREKKLADQILVLHNN